jgi:superfamily I DNA and/or RNA helicase
VLHQAQAVKDLFLVLGPPGTGKTRTITQLVKELADQGQKTLVTSQNNLAVDNVLVRLKGLRVVRIGHEDRVAPDAQHLLIDMQAGALQREISATTEATFRELKEAAARWKKVETEIARLRELPSLWNDRLSRWEETQQAVRAAQLVVWKQYEQHFRQRSVEARHVYYRAVRAIRRAESARGLLEWILAHRSWLMIGVVFVALSSWLLQRARRIHQQAEKEWATFVRLAQRYETDVARYHAAAQGEPAVLTAKGRLQEEEATVRLLAQEAQNGTQRIRDLLSPSPMALPDPAAATPQALVAHLGRLRSLETALEWRYRLLAEWREFLQERRQALYLALIRSADVVGATCMGIGIAANRRFRDLKFDTVIADEAGQIQAFHLLVPLVRARRAILVGDHKQLPPMVDKDVRALLDDEDEESVALLERSLFERLYEAAPGAHKGMLNTQYRMPASIAGFISQFFYKGEYLTDSSQQINPIDPFLSHPMCFVDTGHNKAYREHKGGEGETGYANPGEADILAKLANAYMGQGYEVGAIVPYKLQVAEVQRVLHRHCPELGENELRNIVATVDSFQGKERDTILFGFTRSNDWGSVGFMRELRRLNVTITRAQRQLVLVGDSHTLTQASDGEFRKFACDLLEYIRRYGQYVDLRQLEELFGDSYR